MNVGWGVPGELKDSHEESPVFPQPAALGKETEEVFMGLPAVAGVAPEWGISLQTLSRARLNFNNKEDLRVLLTYSPASQKGLLPSVRLLFRKSRPDAYSP